MNQADPDGGVAPCSTRVMNLSNFLTQAARRNADEAALVWGDRQWRWSEMEARVNAMAYALIHEFGDRKGDRILVQSSNCNQMFESMFAAFRVGAVWVPTNFRQTPDEVSYLAASSGQV
ncbi:AMP-binding protein [Pseudomonas sp. SB113]|uniref:AMP-binding protein n=1 Tax=Pseudomonas sp. SB113 TaxID=3154123 RepID=UPI00345D12B4